MSIAYPKGIKQDVDSLVLKVMGAKALYFREPVKDKIAWEVAATAITQLIQMAAKITYESWQDSYNGDAGVWRALCEQFYAGDIKGHSPAAVLLREAIRLASIYHLTGSIDDA